MCFIKYLIRKFYELNSKGRPPPHTAKISRSKKPYHEIPNQMCVCFPLTFLSLRYSWKTYDENNFRVKKKKKTALENPIKRLRNTAEFVQLE